MLQSDSDAVVAIVSKGMDHVRIMDTYDQLPERINIRLRLEENMENNALSQVNVLQVNKGLNKEIFVEGLRKAILSKLQGCKDMHLEWFTPEWMSHARIVFKDTQVIVW